VTERRREKGTRMVVTKRRRAAERREG